LLYCADCSHEPNIKVSYYQTINVIQCFKKLILQIGLLWLSENNPSKLA